MKIKLLTILLSIIILLLLFDKLMPNKEHKLNTTKFDNKIQTILNSNEKLKEDNITLTQSNILYSSIIDSLQLNSINTLQSNLDANMARLNANRTDTVYIYDIKDTIISEQDSLIYIKDTIINYKDTIINNLSTINHNLQVKQLNLDTILSHKDSIISFQTHYIDDIKKDSKRKNIRSFINGAIIGTTIGIIIILVLK